MDHSHVIGPGEDPLGGVGQHDAEPERVLDPVPLVDRDFCGRIGTAEEDGQVEPPRPAPDDGDLHAPPSTSLAIRSRWISVVPS